MALSYHLGRAQGYCHVCHCKIPLLPCSAIEPDVALFCPILVLQTLECSEHSLNAYTVCAMRVGKVARCIYLMGLHLLHKFHHDVNILFGKFALLYASRLIEGKIEEVCISAVVKTECAAGCACLGTSDGALDVEQTAGFGHSGIL